MTQTDFHHAKPLYEEFPGWWEDISKCRTFRDLPKAAREYVDASYKVFCSERNVVFRESEYAVPRENVVDVVRRLRDWIDSSGSRIPFPIEVRVAAPDDIWLSTAYGRDTAYVAIHQYHRLPHDPYFQAFERIVSDYNARPHWGKLHTLTASDLRTRYPRFDDFLRVRDQVDPDGRFRNAYLDRILGPPTRVSS